MMKSMFRINAEKEKIFCIGLNKTGTTSLEKALLDLNYKLGDQSKAQGLMGAYSKRNFKKIIDFCKSAEAFQDAPFSYYYTFIALDQYFRNGKFILSVRNSPEEWYDSLVNFHSKLYGQNGELPTMIDLKKAKRPEGRTVWDNMSMRYNVSEDSPYDKNKLINYYNTHTKLVADYFRYKNNLLIINLSEENSYERFCDFLGVKPLYEKFPWENKTINI